MVIKREGTRTVAEAAERRILNAFSNGKKVYLSFSGGKDSLCLLDVTLKLAGQGTIDPSMLIVQFIDEEAIFPCIEKIVHAWRNKALGAGALFTWFCLEVKHFSCFNTLEEEETFICWDRTQQEVWVRRPPACAVMDHPQLKRRTNTYQEFLTKHNADGIVMTGVRMAESMQRSQYMAASFSSKTGLARGNMVWPLYDWKDTDVWRYLYERGIEIPDIYWYLYLTGRTVREMRVSQFFSVDTAKSLVSMNEYYPGLMDRIMQREPNAYLAALYWDSEMFRRSTRKRKAHEAPKDYQAAVYQMLRNPHIYFVTKGSLKNARWIIKHLIKYSAIIKTEHFKAIYTMLVGGDPKQRALRALITHINLRYAQDSKGAIHGR